MNVPVTGPQPQPPAAPIVVDVARRNTRKVWKGTIGLWISGAVFLAIAVVAALRDGLGDTAGLFVGCLVIGLVLIGIGSIPVLRRKTILRTRKFVFDAAGIRWDDPQGAPWAVRWEELGKIAISTTGVREATRYVDRHAAGKVRFEGLVRVDLMPTDPGAFRARHPEMEHLWQFDNVRDGYRVPLGPNANVLIAQLENAIRQFDRSGVYHGVEIEAGWPY